MHQTFSPCLKQRRHEPRADAGRGPLSGKNIPTAFSTVTFKHFHGLIQLKYRKHFG